MKRDSFIDKSNIVHKNKYDYSKVEYKTNRIDVIIVCPIHGDFTQKPHNHISGKSCPSCSKNKKLNLEDFLERSSIKHKNKYDYTLVDFKNSITPVKIICKIHGEFEQKPVKHVHGSGCQECGGSKKSNTTNFIKKAILIHGDKYDYSLVDYKSNKEKVTILCPLHGKFNITPSNHLNHNVGCSKCVNKCKLTTQDFIDKSNKIHNNLYLYTKTNYNNHKSKVIISCKKHGDFNQVANQHLRGRGCPKCNNSKYEIFIEKFLIENNIKYHTQFKFKDLKYKKELKFDFAILNDDGSVNFLLEYNGEQHYIFRGQYNMKIEDFNEGQLRDKIKLEYCKNKKINIQIIKYNEDVNLRLKEILTKFISL